MAETKNSNPQNEEEMNTIYTIVIRDEDGKHKSFEISKGACLQAGFFKGILEFNDDNEEPIPLERFIAIPIDEEDKYLLAEEEIGSDSVDLLKTDEKGVTVIEKIIWFLEQHKHDKFPEDVIVEEAKYVDLEKIEEKNDEGKVTLERLMFENHPVRERIFPDGKILKMETNYFRNYTNNSEEAKEEIFYDEKGVFQTRIVTVNGKVLDEEEDREFIKRLPISTRPDGGFRLKTVPAKKEMEMKPEEEKEKDLKEFEEKFFDYVQDKEESLEMFLHRQKNPFLELMVVANYLEARNFMDLMCFKIASMISYKTPDQILEILGLPDTLTDEEKERIKKEIIWVDE